MQVVLNILNNSLIDKIERQINSLAIDEIVPFSYINLKDVSKDTIRKNLHRLHDRGIISIINRGYFKKIEPYHEFLFVYGSLKKGFDNHRLLEKSTRRLGKASTVAKFGMYEDSFGNYPFLVKKPISKVTGELYEIKRKELLDKIDDFEGAPDYYQRVKIKVKTHHGVNHAYAYIRENFDISEDQKPLKEWQNDMDYKVNKLNSLVDLTNLPTDEDNNHCIQIKPDQSLEDNGIEISIPITSQEGVKYYIKKILPLIKKYGYTNKDTGLHFHISIINKDGANFNFYLYMLMCHDKELLSSWQPRIGYSQNVMDILFKNTKALSREIKNAKGTIWNLEKLKTDHKEQIKNSDKEKVAQFSSAVTEAGLLPE